jgi:ribosome-interacting GTPase 1
VARSKKVEIKYDEKPTSYDEKEFAKALLKTINFWRRLLKLEDWNISVEIVSPEKLPEDHIAEVLADYIYLQAIIWISNEIQIEWFDSIISHELLHVKVGIIADKIRYFQDRITMQEAQMIKEAEESVVESLSRILCQLLKVDRYHSGNGPVE